RARVEPTIPGNDFSAARTTHSDASVAMNRRSRYTAPRRDHEAAMNRDGWDSEPVFEASTCWTPPRKGPPAIAPCTGNNILDSPVGGCEAAEDAGGSASDDYDPVAHYARSIWPYPDW